MPAFDFVLAGRYRLVAPLGEGGMAAVYRGRDLRLNRDVAIKVLHDGLTRDPDFLSRFEREAQFVASLSHPHIVPVYDVGEESGTHFIVMEYVRGRTLKETIEAEGRMAPSRAAAIMRHILDALGYAHERGLVHRDVKPQNVLLSSDGTARLADFGIARLSDGSSTRTAAILGSAEYLSPEQSRGEDATPQSDIYACGIVLFEMLSGSPPFNGANALAIANQHIQTPPPPLGPSIDQGLKAAVSRALAKVPQDRFADAADFGAALERAAPMIGQTSYQPLASEQSEVFPLTLAPATALAQSGAHPQNPLILRRSTRKNWLAAAALAALLGVVLYAASVPTLGASLPAYPSAPYAILPTIMAGAVVAYWLRTRSWVYSLDSSAAVVQWGVIGHHRFGIPLAQVATLELKQSPLDRLMGIGTVELWGRDQQGAERRLVLEDVPRPRQAYEEIMRFMAYAVHDRPKLP